jgi:hypothetical protein
LLEKILFAHRLNTMTCWWCIILLPEAGCCQNAAVL